MNALSNGDGLSLRRLVCRAGRWALVVFFGRPLLAFDFFDAGEVGEIMVGCDISAIVRWGLEMFRRRVGSRTESHRAPRSANIRTATRISGVSGGSFHTNL